MIWVALTLGFVGSLHCIGMCGPLALLACQREDQSMSKSNFFYNIGRISTYTLLGGIFGVLGTFLFVLQFQKWIAIAIGIIMVLSIFSSMNIDGLINKIPLIKLYHHRIQKIISSYIQKAKSYSPYVLGMLNGLVPCGLVYLAIAGSIASPHWTDSMLFMFFFGIGTLPAMMGLVAGFQILDFKKKIVIKKLLPVVTMFFGAFLVYRGIMVEMPMELNFWEAMKNPILCH